MNQTTEIYSGLTHECNVLCITAEISLASYSRQAQQKCDNLLIFSFCILEMYKSVSDFL